MDAGRRAGFAAYGRADDRERLLMLAEVIARTRGGADVNRPMIGGFLRFAWTDEGYFGGPRRGNYFTALARLTGVRLDVDGIFGRYRDVIMMDDEAETLRRMPDEITVYRGGVGGKRAVTTGRAWTLSEEVAVFFAEVWPARWGLTGRAVVMEATVGRDDVLAYIDERNEKEIVLRDPRKLFANDRGRR